MFRPLVDISMRKGDKEHLVNYNLSAQEIVALQRGFPELNVVVTGKINHPHAMAAATKDCSEELMLKMMNYHSAARSLIKGKDVYLIDIGANYVRHITRGRFNVHCCNPIIDFRDSAREMDRHNQLLYLMREKKISKKNL